MRSYQKSNLLATSAKSDVQVSNGILAITGLDRLKLSDVVAIEHKPYKAEVVQVYTIGTVAPVVTANTVYSVKIMSPGRTQGFENTFKKYAYTSPAILSGSAVTDRTLMYAALAKQINTDASNNVAAVATAGTSLVITDKTGYYPARPSTRGGKSAVLTPDGFIQSTMLVQTTDAIYSFGDGTRMIQDLAVLGPVTGDLDTGELDGVTGAVAGQFYDAFVITHRIPVRSNAVSGLVVFAEEKQLVFVDNGRGASVTNLAGYVAFRREMLKAITVLSKNDPAVIAEFFDENPQFYPAVGYGNPVGTGNATNWMRTFNGVLEYSMIGTGTILAPTWTTAGLKLDLDVTDTEGLELSAQIEAVSPKEYTVSKTEFSVKARLVMTTAANGAWLIGFRKKEAFTATFDNYTNLVAIGTLAAAATVITTQGILADAATVSTSTAKTMADATAVDVEVQVDINGVAKCILNGVAYPVYSAGTTPLVFAAGTIMIPFVRAVNVGGAAPITTITGLLALPAIISKY